MDQKERVEQASVAAWVAANRLLEYATVAADNFGVRQGEPEARDYAVAARGLRTRLRRVVLLALDVMVACARVEILAEERND